MINRQGFRGSLQFLLTTVICALSADGRRLYFPMPEVELLVPPEVHPEMPLLRVQALLESGATPAPGTVTYRLEDPTWLAIDSNSGELRLRDSSARKEGDTIKTFVTATWSRAWTSRYVLRMTIVIMLLPPDGKTFDCDSHLEDLCFWSGVRYQVFENRPATLLGPLGPRYMAALCPQHALSYSLSNATRYVSLRNEDASSWSLRSQPNLDRDHAPSKGSDKGPGAEVYTRVVCTVATPAGTVALNTTLSAAVLDEDDSPPRAQTLEPIDVYLGNDGLVKGGKVAQGQLIFQDDDTVQVNHLSWDLLQDELRLLSLNCNMVDLHNSYPVRTALVCILIANKTSPLPKEPYEVLVRINDTSMLPSSSPSNVAVTLRLYSGSRPATPVPVIGSTVVGGSARRPSYPAEVSILRGATNFSRVVQPDNGAPSPDTWFRLVRGGDGPFAITTVGGIVYVQDMMALRAAPEEVLLVIEWTLGGNRTHLERSRLLVTVVNASTPVCSGLSGEPRMCATNRKMNGCLATCGMGTGGHNLTARGGCVWRGSKKGLDSLSTNYSTCTPDLDTCPDGVCDPLEKQIPELCPQDCTTFSIEIGLSMNPSKVGISSAVGVCTCDVLIHCYSNNPDVKKQNITTTTVTPDPPPVLVADATVVNETVRDEAAIDRGVSAQKAEPRSACGPECTLGVIAASILLIGATVGFVLWKYRMGGKGRRDRKFVGSVTSLSGVQSDYLERGLQSGDTTLLAYDIATPLTSPDPRTTPDPKWEFPRSRLVIEQTLGEGEFGRVLRARATDIAGTPGCTTVAVKTLKEGASASELSDLLSEYQLLKEVSHPNVVRLLGACTAPGAPVYLIIEFAEHGSLRNYLRKSRHLESDGQIPCSFELGPAPTLADTNPAPTPATPRDILSFAWQISKGMAYLSEIKLVHRDLAARNVLVAAGGVCKISDFGLTRDVYEDDAYLKRSKGRVPVKWMALESLADHMYTSKTDVWSFGVLMWELVTLGASPYPGVAVHNLFHLLRAGYRMERPENCSTSLYLVMRSCWQEDPSERPSFKELMLIFERMLEDGVEYLDLNPRIVHNRTYFTTLSSSRDLLDDSDVGYGNLSVLPTDSVNYLTPQQRHTPITRVNPLPAAEEEQHLLDPLRRCASSEIDKLACQSDSEKQEESPRQGNAYLSPIKHPNSLNRLSSETAVLNLSSGGLAQPYINMVGSPIPLLMDKSKRESCQELLASTPSPVASKVTPF